MAEDPRAPLTPPRRTWPAEAWERARHRPDLLAGLIVLGVGTAVLCWVGMWEVPWYARIPVVVIADLLLVGMTLGMIHDYTDPDERDSREWLDAQRSAVPPRSDGDEDASS